jgi:hypothetical protein
MPAGDRSHRQTIEIPRQSIDLRQARVECVKFELIFLSKSLNQK